MLNASAQQLVSPATFTISARAAELKAAGYPVLNLSIGEPDFTVPDAIKIAAHAAIDEDCSFYTPTGGLPILKDACIAKMKRDYALDYSYNEITCGAGGKQMLFNFFEVILEKGDQVILTDPAWLSYVEQIKWAGGVPTCVPTTPENNFNLTAEALKEALNAKTKVVLINSPGNPTGGVISEEELGKIMDVLEGHHALILSDDVYEFFSYDAPQAHVLRLNPKWKERVVTVNSLSKTYAMTGWRLGFAAGPSKIIAAMEKRQSLSTSNPCSIVQMAAVCALNGPQDSVLAMRSAFKKRRDLAVDKLNKFAKLPFVRPQGAFYILMDVGSFLKSGESDLDFCERLLEEHFVAMVPGSVFGMATQGWIRMSIASSEAVIDEALDRLFKFLDF